MDDLLLDDLGRSLVWLERLSPLVDDLVFPHQASSGENAGIAPAAKGSRPPVSVSMVDLKRATEDLLGFWCGQLVGACPAVGHAPPTRGVVSRAGWLRAHLPEIEAMPWASMLAEEIVSQARLVGDVVDPPPSADDPAPLEVGPVREIVAWCRYLEVGITERSVRRWVTAGELPSWTAPDGRTLVALADVVARTRAIGGRVENVG